MTTLETLRSGRSALRQLKSLARAHALTDREFDRLVGKIDAAFDQVIGADPVPPSTPAFHVLNGGRA